MTTGHHKKMRIITPKEFSLAKLVVIALLLLIAPLQLNAQESPASAKNTNSAKPSASKLSEFSTKYLTSIPVQLEKAEVIISSKTLDYLSKKRLSQKSLSNKNASSGSTSFWVFFADKGPSASSLLAGDPLQFESLKKSMQRRAKVGLDKIVFADLPLETNYISQIEKLGLKTIRSSRWLNATVFSIESQQDLEVTLNKIAALPFVIEIKPALAFTRDNNLEKAESIQESPQDPTNSTLYRSSNLLNYGASLSQISQIKAEVGHQRGFKGQGVTLAMFDTGYRKTHLAFSIAYTEGRVLAEYDFINNDANTANELGEPGSQWNHGTLTWSTAGGQIDGSLYGPAYGANFLLAKTENVSSETVQEEYDWVAAMEWADSLGADVISSSLAYIDWYTYSDLDGATAVTSIAASMAAGLGIVVNNAMGNSGSSSASLLAPADAFDILSVGAVDNAGNVASFSSRGPTFDGRTKPEVCARGVATFCASSNSNVALTTANGTSLSTPLVAGAAAQLISANPTFPPIFIIRSLKETASQPFAPDNDIGWGVINVEAALDWGVNFTANGSASSIVFSDLPASVNFADNSEINATDWSWDFGDSQSSNGNSAPSHDYNTTGLYSVGLTIGSAFGPFSKTKTGLVLVVADTVKLASDSGYAGNSFPISVNLTNTQALQSIALPISYADPLIASLDSITLGARTSAFLDPQQMSVDPFNRTIGVRITSAGATLDPGEGEVMKVYVTLDPLALGGTVGSVDSATIAGSPLELTAPEATYPPKFEAGSIRTKYVRRGDANNDITINIADVTFLVARIFAGSDAPITIQSGDANSDIKINIGDVTYLITHIFHGGPPPQDP